MIGISATQNTKIVCGIYTWGIYGTMQLLLVGEAALNLGWGDCIKGKDSSCHVLNNCLNCVCQSGNSVINDVM